MHKGNMVEKYTPEYSKGEIIVFFRKKTSANFAKEFSEKLGYEFLKDIELPSAYLIKTVIGKEKEAMKKFESCSEFVKEVGRRDLRYEREEKFAEELNGVVEDLICSAGTNEFDSGLEEIINYIKNFKDIK